MSSTNIKEALKETEPILNAAFNDAARDLPRFGSVAEDKVEQTRHTIKMSPLVSVMVAATAGLVLGFLATWVGNTARRN